MQFSICRRAFAGEAHGCLQLAKERGSAGGVFEGVRPLYRGGIAGHPKCGREPRKSFAVAVYPLPAAIVLRREAEAATGKIRTRQRPLQGRADVVRLTRHCFEPAVISRIADHEWVPVPGSALHEI